MAPRINFPVAYWVAWTLGTIVAGFRDGLGAIMAFMVLGALVWFFVARHLGDSGH